MQRKNFRMDESDIMIINTVKMQQGLKNESEALRYIIRDYEKKKKEDEKLRTAVLRGIEEKLDLLLDVANTDLIKRSEEVLYPVRMVESPIITKARKLRRQDLSNKKQRSDYNKKKNS